MMAAMTMKMSEEEGDEIRDDDEKGANGDDEDSHVVDCRFKAK